MDDSFPWFWLAIGGIVALVVLNNIETVIGLPGFVVLVSTVGLGLLAFILLLVIALSRSINEKSQEITETINEHLDKAFKAMGGEEKLKEVNKAERRKLRKRLIKMLAIDGQTQKEAEQEAERLFEEAEFEETHSEYPHQFENIKKWVIAQEIEERNKAKYGKLLPRAREFIKDKEKIEKYGDEMEKFLNTDSKGTAWLIKCLEEEKLIEPVKEWNSGLEYNELKYWSVVK